MRRQEEAERVSQAMVATADRRRPRSSAAAASAARSRARSGEVASATSPHASQIRNTIGPAHSPWLSINAVRIEAGVASVDLTARALNANTRQRQLLKSQIRATLTQLTSVASVNIFIERSPQDIIDAPIPTRTRTTFNPFALTEEALYRVSNTTAAKLQSSEAIVAELKPTKFAVSQDESLVAFSTERGVEIANLGGVAAEPRLVDTRTGLLTGCMGHSSQGTVCLRSISRA